jgi:thiol-disulfide isomerase/thioredoxin
MKENTEQQKREKSQQTKRFFLILIPLIFILGGLSFYLLSNPKQPTITSSHNFRFETVQQKILHIQTSTNQIKIKEFNGKIVFLKVFGWNCPYCQKEIPELIQLKKKFKSAFNTIAIEDQYHTHQENLDFIKKFHVNYGIIEGKDQEAFLAYLKKEYHWNGVIPLTIVIDATGKLLAFEVGYKSYSLTTLLQTTLKQLTQTALAN